jgi:phage host-nuclease inhibitor protein Gam
MSRIKPDRVYPVPTLADCDVALARIAKLQRALAAADAAMNETIDQAKARCATTTAGDRAELEQIVNGIEAFGESNKAELFTGGKTQELAHGFIGFRQSTFVKITKKTLELLKQYRKVAALKITESVRKDVLMTWTDKDLATVNAHKEVEDKFWFEVKDEEVARSRS